jgi:uncharacterized protein YxjI
MLMSQMPPAGWHPDPFRRSEHRYWDGGRWTEHVASHGQQWIDQPVGVAPPAVIRPISAATPPTPVAGQSWPTTKVPGTSKATKKIQKQVQKVGIVNTAGGPDLAIHSEPILVINQKGKLVELRAEYAVYDRNGLQLAAVRGKRMSSRIQVVDMAGRSLLDLRREATLLSSKVIVTGEDGAKVGRIVPSKNLNQVDRSFKLEDVGNEMIGAVYAEDRRQHRDFNVQDTRGSVVARISKTRAGLAKELFTKGDNYVLEFPGHLTGPLRLLSIATALIVDRSFHQR